MAAKDILMGPYYIRGYLQGVINRGLEPGAVLDAAGLPADLYDSPDALINGHELQSLILQIRTALNDHYMGFLQVPGKLAMDAEAGRAAVREKTLGEGMRSLAAFINAVRSDEERDIVIDEKGGQVAMIYRFSDFIDNVNPHLLYWYRLYWGYRFYCWLIGQRIKLTRVCFSAKRPAASIDYDAAFGCKVHFEQPDDRYSFDTRYLVEANTRTEVELFSGVFPGKYPNWFTLPGRDQSLTCQVEQIMIELTRQGMPSPSIDVIAGIVATSTRTLARRLGRENSTFQDIKTRVRSDRAKHLLAHSDLSIAEVAEEIGFAEAGDFTRAFVSWAGCTPSTYRNDQRGLAGGHADNEAGSRRGAGED